MKTNTSYSWGSKDIWEFLEESHLYDTLGLSPVVAGGTYFGMPHTEDCSPVFVLFKFEPSQNRVLVYRGEEEVSWTSAFVGFKESIRKETELSIDELDKHDIDRRYAFDLLAYRLVCKRISENTDNAITYLKQKTPVTRITLVSYVVFLVTGL
jgi:hypothetical protein